MRQHGLAPEDYQALMIDTQGSELLVLQGSVPLLPRLRFIQTEAADFEAYAGGCQLRDLQTFMDWNGYPEYIRRPFARRAGVGTYYNVVYRNRSAVRTCW